MDANKNKKREYLVYRETQREWVEAESAYAAKMIYARNNGLPPLGIWAEEGSSVEVVKDRQLPLASQCAQTDEELRRNALIEAAREHWSDNDDNITVGDDAHLSETEGGFWIQAWVFVDYDGGKLT